MSEGKQSRLSPAQKADVWRGWKAGESLHEMGRPYGKPHNCIRCVLLPRGGIVPAARRRSRIALTLAEREDISRGIASGSSIIPGERKPPDVLERWLSEDIDVRHDPVVGEQIQAFLRQHQARSVVVTDRVIDCPHEEGIDYPEGHSCPHCPYWAGRDRFTPERFH